MQSGFLTTSRAGIARNLPPQAEFTEADVTDPDVVGRAFDGIDGCFHLAAIASVERSHEEWLRTHRVNLTGTINVFDQARPARRRREGSCRLRLDRRSVRQLWEQPVDEESPAAPLSALRRRQTRLRAPCPHRRRHTRRPDGRPAFL
jgi:UDP-glucose 4-epimerase